ncbi:hypothetical protein PR003_g3346 [Phytophthora rubi]|uniref:Uncharacterized protein n=1 Tax=Phytophthora rubi TaxID=129364 RepID=A0A6A3PA41_9STRA|nr:hypothetical protein PR002_g2462 [Phytophthora rubi]KAE9049315.1 hypothetical protein PR001_g3431 [Phytophthora rubi]KAE9354453.1 hypothetical protein PR003_g3346 [Phytophthora rubi]
MAIFLGDDNPPETLVVGSGPLLELLPEKLVMGGDLVQEELVVNRDLLPEKLVAGSEPPDKLVGSEPLETLIVVIFLLGELAAGAA